jgi:hypothetical protein
VSIEISSSLTIDDSKGLRGLELLSFVEALLPVLTELHESFVDAARVLERELHSVAEPSFGR